MWLLLMQNNSSGILFFLSGGMRKLFLYAAPFCLFSSFSLLPHYMRQKVGICSQIIVIYY